MSSHDLTTEDGLRAYIKTTGRSEEVDMTLLTGGTANYVYRVSRIDSSTSIFKHAAPYLHSNKNFPFDPTRMDYEARALEILSPTNSHNPLSRQLPDSAVHAVQLMSYDNERKLLCIEDGGSQNLKDAYNDPELDIPHAGEELAKWVAALHVCSRGISLASPNQNSNATGVNNNTIAISIYRHSYKNLHVALSQHGHDPKIAERINAEFGSRLETDDECICHGDFWPGNVLVRLNKSQQQPFDLTIVDWEMVRRGTSATDVGQFAAEAFLLDRFRGGRGLLPMFLNAYVAARESDERGSSLGKTWLRRVVVHWAVHIAFWPTRVVWTDKEGTQRLVDIGVGVLKDVLDDNWEALLESPLLKSGKEVWATVILRE